MFAKKQTPPESVTIVTWWNRPQKDLSMSTAEQYRAKASEYANLLGMTNGADELLEFQRLERSFTELANNAQWVSENQDKTVHAA